MSRHLDYRANLLEYSGGLSQKAHSQLPAEHSAALDMKVGLCGGKGGQMMAAEPLALIWRIPVKCGGVHLMGSTQGYARVSANLLAMACYVRAGARGLHAWRVSPGYRSQAS